MAMVNEFCGCDTKTHLFEIDRAARITRRTKVSHGKANPYHRKRSTGKKLRRNHQYETTLEEAETRQVLVSGKRIHFDI